MINRKRAWTPEDDERLRAHIAAGGSAARAVAMFRRSEQAIRTHALELGLRFPSIRELRARAGALAGPPQAGI
jgi:hypothetical protein